MSATAEHLSAEVLVFEIAGWRYGIPASDVRELLRSVTVTPLPNAPAAVEGLVNVRGAVIAVLDLRKRLGLPAKALDPADHFVLARTGGRDVVLRVDRALDVLQVPPEDIENVRKIALTEGFLAGVAKLADGLVLIHDLGRFLSSAEALALDMAMAQAQSAPQVH
ncbi:MAG: chemotaxis protein CheW [bacterium]